MKFPCTGCGACCAKVQGHYIESLEPYGGVRADGSCSNYDRWTKKCMIYETRPDICHVEKICPPYVEMQDHFDSVEKYCDTVHLQVYNAPREIGTDCNHMEPRIRLQFETVSTCNAACHFCVYPKVASLRRGKQMDEALFRKIVDEASEIPSIAIYSMQGLGEPTLDRSMKDRLLYIREKDPNSQIELFTNGLLAHKEKVSEYFDAGLDCLIFSLNAVDDESHQRSMGMVGKFDKICNNIQDAIEIVNNDDRKVRIHATALTEPERQQFEKRWGGFCKYIGIGNWGGEIEASNRPFKPNECCPRSIGTIYVMYDGRVTMCCFDPLGEGAVFGDLNKQTLREIYSSPEYVQFREDHFNDRADKYDRCANCTRI